MLICPCIIPVFERYTPYPFLFKMAASSSYSWENPEQGWRCRPPAAHDEPSDSEEDDTDPTAEEAGEYLVSFLLELLYTNALSARSLCIICHWASLAGARGPVSDYKLKPDSPSGHFQRKVDKVTGIDLKTAAKDMYKVLVPQHSKYDMSRTAHEMVINVPHEEFATEVSENPGAASGHLDPEWSEDYQDHPVVKANPGQRIMAFAFYLDGISFTKNDSLLGLYVYSLHSFKRHLCMVFRRSHVCKCGCKGWCTLYPAFLVLRWSFRALAAGVWPSVDHTGEAFPEGSRRALLAGTPFSFHGALVHIKGDWAEFSHTLGFADWSSALFCCLFCKATRENRFNVAGFGPVSSPWGDLSHADMERACAACEIWIDLTQEQHARVRASLVYDKKKDGGAGRCLMLDLPDLNLRAKDRLEPHPLLMDVDLFDRVAQFPYRALFWRRSLETRCRHRNPLWDPDIGITLERLMVDKLHTLHMGPAMSYVCHVLWQLILVDAWGTGASGEQLHVLSVHQIRSELWTYYSDRKRQRPDDDITELQDLTLQMLGGKPSSQTLHTKAAETKGLVGFALELLKRMQGRFAGSETNIAFLIGAGEALQEYFDLLGDAPRQVPPRMLQRMFDSMKKHLILSNRAGVPMKPKHHLVLHMVARTGKYGNPSFYATFTDEGINKLLKKVGQAAHRTVWEVRVLLHFGKVEETRSSRKRHMPA